MDSGGRDSRATQSAVLFALAALAASVGCAGIKSPVAGSGGGGGSLPGVDGGHQQGRPDGPAALPDADSCVKTTCKQPTGTYCGIIGDGCSGQLDCGACSGDQVCEKGLCVSGASCVPSTCPTGAIKYCDKIGDGCGRSLDCGGCAAGQTCSSGICVDPGCVPLTCNAGSGFQYCGMVGDGCGGTLNCTCTTGTCGGGGIPSLCGSTNCPTAVTCMPAGGGQYCGVIGNGCGGILQCGTCPGGAVCGAQGVCPGAGVTVCQNLQCNIQTCSPTTKTSISGTVYDPAGKIPLYNALVYIPNAPLEAVPEGVSCDKCNITLSGSPLATALSDTAGHFTLTNVPSGANVPMVIQVGKWRRQVTIPAVAPCVNNPITDVNLTRLPRTQSEGHMPKIALTTGGSDALECFLRKTGIADSEFTTVTGTGRVNMYVGGQTTPTIAGQGANAFSPALGGQAFPNAATLWGNPTSLLTYDILMMSCEGGQYATTKAPFVANIKRYADAGGRLFNDHLHFYWLRNGVAPWPATASYIGNGPVPVPDPVTMASAATVNVGFPKGAALASWLTTVGASATPGQVQLFGAQYSVAAVTAPTQAWITLNQSPPAIEYLTFNTPVESVPDAQCGRVVETDIHVKAVPSSQNGKDDSDPSKAFPIACLSTTLSAQEKALEFLFFDLAACVQPDTQQPQPPVVPPPGVPTSPPPSVTPPPSVPPPPPPPPPPIIP